MSNFVKMYDFQGMNDYSDIFLLKNSFHLIRLSKPSMILYLVFLQFMFMMVIWIFRISTATWNYTSFIGTGIISVNVIYVALIVKTFFSDCVGKSLYSWWNFILPSTFWQTIDDVVFMKNGITIASPNLKNKSKPFIVKMNMYDIFWWFLFVYLIFIYLL